MAFRVKEVIDGDTFVVSPKWVWRNQTGDRVRPYGYDTPEKDKPKERLAALLKLTNLIGGKTVELGDKYTIDPFGRLVCDVIFEGKNLADYFPEYKT